MLNEEEVHKLEYLTAVIKDAKEEEKFPRLSAYDIEWLVTKLKEADEKLKEMAIPEVYKNPRNEISDRFYPR